MRIVFVETDPSEHDFFKNELVGHELAFVDSLEEVPKDTEAISIFVYSHITCEFLDAHPSLKLIVTRSTSYAHIDLPECGARSVQVCAIDTYGEGTVAEHAFALLLAVARRLPEAAKAHRQEQFSYREIRGTELQNKTLGVVGTGRIGKRLIQIAKAFEMKILALDLHPSPLENVTYVSKDELLANSDIITLHIPLTKQTRHYLDAKAFSRCRRGIIIINTSNGSLIETEALIDAFEKGIVRGAGLDSLEEESVVRREAVGVIADQIIDRVRSATEEEESTHKPGRVHELRKLTRNEMLLSRPDVIFTPHTAFNCHEAIERVNRATVETIRGYLSGERTSGV